MFNVMQTSVLLTMTPYQWIDVSKSYDRKDKMWRQYALMPILDYRRLRQRCEERNHAGHITYTTDNPLNSTKLRQGKKIDTIWEYKYTEDWNKHSLREILEYRTETVSDKWQLALSRFMNVQPHSYSTPQLQQKQCK